MIMNISRGSRLKDPSGKWASGLFIKSSLFDKVHKMDNCVRPEMQGIVIRGNDNLFLMFSLNLLSASPGQTVDRRRKLSHV